MGTMERARNFANRLSLRGVRDSLTSSNHDTSIWTAKTNYAWDMRLLFKRRITNSYVAVSALKSYVDTNYTGFRKILKK
jgi:phosphate transporter